MCLNCGTSLDLTEKDKKKRCIRAQGKAFCSEKCSKTSKVPKGPKLNRAPVQSTRKKQPRRGARGVALELCRTLLGTEWGWRERICHREAISAEQRLEQANNACPDELIDLKVPQAQLAWDATMLGEHTCFIGAGGTGKTTLQGSVVLAIKQHPDLSAKGAVAVCSAHHAGASALQNNCVTFYSYFQLGLFNENVEFYLDQFKKNKVAKDRIIALKRLVLTEANACSPQHFVKLFQVLRAVRESEEPFADVRLSLDGDPCQIGSGAPNDDPQLQ